MKNMIKIEKLRYRKWSAQRSRNLRNLRGKAYSVKLNKAHMLCLSSECYPNLKKTIDNDIYFYGFKDCGSFTNRSSWENAYRTLRQELNQIIGAN